MRIGIDIDGVLTNIERFIVDYGTKFCIENNLPMEIETGYYDESKAFHWTEDQTLKFWNEYLVYYATKYPARDFASEVVHKLKEEGHEIYIVTARNEYGLTDEYYGKMRELVDAWLKDNDICYDKIVYTEGSKLPYCVGNYVELLIEDNPEQVKNVAEKLPVFCFDNQYNKNVEGKNITRVFSWYDVYDKIKNKR